MCVALPGPGLEIVFVSVSGGEDERKARQWAEGARGYIVLDTRIPRYYTCRSIQLVSSTWGVIKQINNSIAAGMTASNARLLHDTADIPTQSNPHSRSLT